MTKPVAELEGPVSSGPAPIGTMQSDGPDSAANDAAEPEQSNVAAADSAASNAEQTDAPPSAPRAKTADVEDESEASDKRDEPHFEPPPADPTEIPADRPSLLLQQDPPAQEARAKPLLASEALMDDLAPHEPSRMTARYWCGALGLGFAALGALPLVGLRPGNTLSAGLSFFLAGVSLVAALAQVTYRQRAFAMLALGLIVVVTGLGGTGPAAFIANDAPVLGLARGLAATALPGALLFRHSYRAYAGARWLLGAAFLVALPFMALVTVRVFTHSADLSMAGSIMALVVTLAGLVGFMGKETTGAGTYVGLSVLVGLGVELCLSDLSHPGAFDSWKTILAIVLGSVTFVAATGLSALGLFQLLASRFSGEARRIDLHAAQPEPSRPRNANKSEWSV